MSLVLDYDAFLRSIKQNKSVEHAVLLGAGASIESGIQSAVDCIWEWKRDIYVSQNPTQNTRLMSNHRTDVVQKTVQAWLDGLQSYPKLGDPSEYSFYAEKALPIESDRRKYFQNLCEGKQPSVGYHLLCYLAGKGFLRSVWTTNFDNLIVKSAYTNNLTPIEISLGQEMKLHRPSTPNELICVELHGDYKYGPLKNTDTELDTQSDHFASALENEIGNRNLVIIGYSGRDDSLMSVLKKAYSSNMASRLYWCGYGADISDNVRELISLAQANGNEAYYVPTNGFDTTIYNLATTCYADSPSDQLQINDVIKANGDLIINENLPFCLPRQNVDKVAKSNMFPLSMPKSCLQFEIKSKEKLWRVCRIRSSEKQFTCVPYNGMIYALGRISDVADAFNDELNSNIEQTPLVRESIIASTALQELILHTVVDLLITQNTNLRCNHKNIIWDIERVSQRHTKHGSITCYEGVQFALHFDAKYTYVTIEPTIVIDSSVSLEVRKEVKKELSKQFLEQLYGMQPNKKFDEYNNRWRGILFSGDTCVFEYPAQSGSGHRFIIKNDNVYVGITSKEKDPKSVEKLSTPKQIVYSGIDFLDPQIQFYNPITKKLSKDFHPMRGLIQNAPFDTLLNATSINPDVSLAVICPKEHSDKFARFLNRFNSTVQVRTNTDYLIDYPSFQKIYKLPINIPTTDSYLWQYSTLPSEPTVEKTSAALARDLTLQIEHLHAQKPGTVVTIFIPSEWEYFIKYSDEKTSFDLHDYIKAYAAQKGISTQLIREKTIVDDNDIMFGQILWWLSLAFYVKTLRTPWILNNPNSDTAYAGIGFSLQHHNADNKIVLGCSHVYTPEGQGLKYRLSKISDVTWIERKNPKLSEEEAYMLGITIKDLFYSSIGELPKRVVIHRRTPFYDEEIEGLSNSLHSSGVKSLDLIQITVEPHCKFLAMRDGYVSGFPITRGCCFPITDNEAYLFTHGIAASVLGPGRKYVQGGKSVPSPLKLTKHYGDGSLDTISNEILGLTKMNFNSFNLYSKMPCTLESSNAIARIGWLMPYYEARLFDFRYFM